MLNRRSDARNSDNSLSIEIKDGIIGDESIVVPISCLSEKGLSFYISADKFNLREDDIISNIRIFNNDYDKFIEKAQIVYCTKIEIENVETKWKVGVTFFNADNKFNDREKRLKFTKQNQYDHKLSFAINNIIFSNGKIENISKSGISIVLQNTSEQANCILSKELVISDIVLKFKNYETNKFEKFELGEGTILDIEFVNNKFILRVSFSTQFVLLDDLIDLANEKNIDIVIDNLNEDIELKNRVNLEFKENVFEYRYILDNLKNTLDKFEKDIKYKEPQSKNLCCIEVLEKLNNTIKPKIDLILKNLDDISIAQNFQANPDIYEIHSRYYKQNLQSILLNAPINKIAYYKPLGTVWDYSLIEYIYNSGYEGTNLFNKFLHKYTTEIPMLVSYKNSFNYLYRKLKEDVAEKLKDKDIVKVSVFLSGICYELFDFFLYDEISENCDINLFFVSKDSLNYCKQKIDEIKGRISSTRYLNINYEYLPLYNLLSKDFSLENQDIVYSTGISEYLEDAYFSIFINKLFDGLADGGDLYLGQYSENYGYKVYLKMGFDWFVNYRDFEDLEHILNFIPEQDKFVYSSYKLGNLKFLTAKKHI